MSARTRASTGAGPGRPGRRVMEWSERSTLLPALKIGERGSTRQKWQGVVLDAVQRGRGSRRMKKEVDVGRKGRRPDKRVGRIPRGALTCRRRGARREGVPGSGAPTGQDSGLRPPEGRPAAHATCATHRPQDASPAQAATWRREPGTAEVRK